MTTGHVSRCAAIAVVAATTAVALTAHAASSTTMQVNYAWDNRTPDEHDVGSLVVTDLNGDADALGQVRVWPAIGNWWEVALTDPYPLSIPGGSVLTSVLVTVQYKMENAAWTGPLTLDARKGAGISLGTDSSWPEQLALAKQTWDITGLVNGEPDPLDTLNLLRVRIYNMDAAVNVVWDFCEVAVDFNAAPDRPSFTSPGVDEPGVSRNPSLAGDAYGHMEALSHKDSDWEVYDDAGLGSGNRVAYRLADSSNKESIDVTTANVTFENSLAGRTTLLPNTDYWARVRYRDANDLVSDWSPPRHFMTGLGQPPTQPLVTSPSGPGVDRRPAITASAYSDAEGDAHASSDWEVFESPGPADRVAYSLADATNLTSIDVTDANVSFEGTLAGMTSLAPSKDYWVRVTYRDEYGTASTSAAVSFTTAANFVPDTPSITSPSGAGASRTPTVAASAYNDQDFDPHASSDWEVFDAATLLPGDLVASSMADAGNLETIDVNGGTMLFQGSLVGKGNLAPLTDYWVRVTYRDAYGGEATSSTVQFTTVANAPPAVASIISPSGPGADRSPTITASAYSDADGDAHASSDWEVFDAASLLPGDRVAYSLADPTDLTSIDVTDANVTFEGTLSGETSLAPSTTYWAVVTYRDGYGAASVSAAATFTTAANLAPETPSVTSPSGPGASRTPTVFADAYNDQDFDTHASSDWEVFDSASLLPGDLVASSMADASNLETIDVNGGTMLFQGSLAGKGSLAPSTDYWVRVTYRDAYGGEATSAEVQFTTVANLVPDTPSITSPSGPGADRRPTVTASAYSEAEGDAHASSDWEIFDDPGPVGGVRVAYSLADATNLTSIDLAPADVTFEGTLSGETSLAPSTMYWVVVTYRDEYGAASTSTAANFTTVANLVPDTPSITSPSGAGASRVPTVTASAYNDQDFDLHASSDWEVFENPGPADLVASSMVDTVNRTSIDVNGGTMLFQGSLVGKGSLAPLTDYWVRVTYRDAYDGEATSAEMPFTTGANVPPAQPTITSPTADQDNVPLNPVITANAYSDPEGDAHAATYWEVHDNPTLTSLVAVGGNPAVNLTSIEIDAANVVFSGTLAGRTSLEPATGYWVVVTYGDELGADSVPSAAVHFTTGDYPEGDAWPFFGSGCSSTLAGRRGDAESASGAARLALWMLAVLVLRRLMGLSGARSSRS